MNQTDFQHGMPIYVRGEDEAIGRPVGSVDHLDGEKYIKLRRVDAPDGKHRWVPMTWVDTIRNGCVFLNKTDQQFRMAVMYSMPTDVQRQVG
jgi:hypothetical protein